MVAKALRAVSVHLMFSLALKLLQCTPVDGSILIFTSPEGNYDGGCYGVCSFALDALARNYVFEISLPYVFLIIASQMGSERMAIIKKT